MGVFEYSGDYKILVDGVIDLFFVGSVDFKGLIVIEVSNIIFVKYVNVLKCFVVVVKFKVFWFFNILIFGEINWLGFYVVVLKFGVG